MGKMADLIRKKRAELNDRYKEAQDRKEPSFTNYSIIDKAKLPTGLSIWYPKAGDHSIDILSFICGNNHPLYEEGSIVTNVDVWVHTNVGPMNKQFACNNKNWDEPDPICTHMVTNRVNWTTFNEKPKRYCYYLVWVHDTPEEEKKGVQIFSASHFIFESKVLDIIQRPQGGGFIPYADIENGKTLAFKIRKGSYIDKISGEKKASSEWSGYQFYDRPAPIPDWVLDQLFSLDEILIMRPDYEEVEKTFYNTGTEPKQKVGEQPVENDPQPTPQPTLNELPKSKPNDVFDFDTCPHDDKGGIFGQAGIIEECDTCGRYDHCMDSKEVEPKVEPPQEPKVEPPQEPKPTLRRRTLRRG